MDNHHKEELSVIVGSHNVFDDQSALSGFFEEVPSTPGMVVVSPESREALGSAANYAYESDIPMYTHRRYNLADEVAASNGILFDLSSIDRIIRVDEPNLLAFVEYGVTFERLKKELDALGLRILMPAAATSSSVVRTLVDRDIILANGATRPYQLTIFHAILADGRIWMSGNDQMCPDGHSEFREDLGPMYSYFFHASEDIFGMPYAAKVFIYRRWEDRRVTAYGFEDCEQAIRAAYLASRHDQVFECVAADARYLSVLLTDNPADADALAGELAPWNVVFGFDNHGKLVDLWDEQTARIAADNGGKKASGEISSRMEEKFEWPWYIHDRDHYRGATEIIDFYAFSSKAPGMFSGIDENVGFETGHVAIPVYYGGAFYCETDLYHGNGEDGIEKSWFDAYMELLGQGAHVSRPRGEVAKVVYEKMDPENIRMIKNLKNVLDPKGLLNRGQLLEGV